MCVVVSTTHQNRIIDAARIKAAIDMIGDLIRGKEQELKDLETDPGNSPY